MTEQPIRIKNFIASSVTNGIKDLRLIYNHINENPREFFEYNCSSMIGFSDTPVEGYSTINDVVFVNDHHYDHQYLLIAIEKYLYTFQYIGFDFQHYETFSHINMFLT